NQERGWNDPPQFSYGFQMSRGPQRNLLNRRAAPPSDSGAGVPPRTPPSSNPLAPPPCGVVPPTAQPGKKQQKKNLFCIFISQIVVTLRLVFAAPPSPVGVATPPPPPGPMGTQREAVSSQSEKEPDVEAVMSVLNRALAACRHTVKDQVCNDVAKRLRLLEDSWRSGRLSLPVRRRMDNLSLELQSGRWNSADDIHRSLMVDHVTEVNQWMVGVKRLIAETRKLSPELLEPLQKPAEPDSAEPVQDSAEPVQDPVSQSS
ncbi:hypothetical protein L3Q82_022636, partial [Scortum barcoo]